MDYEGPTGAIPAAPPEKVGIREILADRAVRLIIVVVFVVMLGFGIVFPILPLYAQSFGVGLDAAGLLVSAFGLTRLIMDPFSGPVVDRLGERQSAALGVGIVGVSAVLTGLAPTFALAVIFRGAGGIGSALLFTALTSYLLKIVPKDRMGRTLGLFYGAFNIGVIAGGPIGGEIAHLFGLASPLFFYAGILFVAGGLYLWLVPDPGAGVNDTETSDEPGPGVRALLRRREFQAAIVLNFAYLWIIGAAYDTLLPLFGNDVLGLSTQAIGVVLGIALAGELVVLYPTGWLMDRSGRRGVAVWSMLAMAVMTSVLGLAETAVVFGILALPLGFTSGVAGVPAGAMLADVAPGRSGTAVGIFRFAGDLGIAVGPLFAGFAADAFGFQWAFLLCAIPVALAAALTAASPETLQKPSAQITA